MIAILRKRYSTLPPRTQRDYAGYIENLRKSFGEASPQEATANSIFDYRAARARQSVVQANREVSCVRSLPRGDRVARRCEKSMSRAETRARTYAVRDGPRVLSALQHRVLEHGSQQQRGQACDQRRGDRSEPPLSPAGSKRKHRRKDATAGSRAGWCVSASCGRPQLRCPDGAIQRPPASARSVGLIVLSSGPSALESDA